MTSRFPVASDHQASVASNESSVTTRIADEGPYARPILPAHRAVDAVLIDAIRASVGPFVPAPWRKVATSATPATNGVVRTFQTPADEPVDEAQPAEEEDALPWIESFLDASAGDADVLDQGPVSEAVSPAIDAVAGIGNDGEFTASVESTADASLQLPPAPTMDSSAPATAEEWPIEEAGEAIRAMAEDLARRTDSKSVEDTTQAPSETPAGSLRMWSEDDMMDIMPVKASTPEVEGTEQWAARARRESEEGSPESAARALEALASRVRSGEIQLPTFSPEMGEAAALAAALAALLTLRR